MINVKKVLELQKKKVEDWHTEFSVTEEVLPFKFIEENHQWNFSLWHEEDIARIKDIDANRIVQAKRNIDGYNQARNNAMEKIDEWILNFLNFNKVVSTESMHSETPGMMIDRLSILALKIFHTHEESNRATATEEHRQKNLARLSILQEQRSDLAQALEIFFKEATAGRRRFKLYRQMKMYNDPELNPVIYQHKN